jgi:hypothetical protein
MESIIPTNTSHGHQTYCRESKQSKYDQGADTSTSLTLTAKQQTIINHN